MHSVMTFSDLVEINPKVLIQKGKEYPFVEMENVIPGRRYVSAQTKRQYKGGGSKFQTGDVLFARITPCLENGKIAQFSAPYEQIGFGSTEFFVFRHKERVSDPAYIFYLAYTDIIRKPAEKSMSGASGRQRADIASIKDLEVPAPSLHTQHKIASILSPYDDLIENNTRRIKILEEMAQLIYREWFVNFRFPGHEKVKMVDSELGPIPEGWEVKNLFDIAEVTYGFPFKSKLFTEEPIGKPIVRIRDIKSQCSKTFTPEEPDSKYLLKNGDLLVGMDGDFHMGKWAGGEAYLNQRIVRFRPKNGISGYYLFLALKSPIEFFDETVVGTTVAHLSDEDLRSIYIALSDVTISEKVMKLFDVLLKQELNLQIKNANLRCTRDLLLPKLISGEVDVSDLDINVEGLDS